jgi:hypothetical protein
MASGHIRSRMQCLTNCENVARACHPRTRYMIAKILSVASVLAMTLGAGEMSHAQSAPPIAQRRQSGIAGVIRDTAGKPISHATIFVDGEKLAAVSDDSGRFDVRGLPSGSNGVTVTKIGYAPVLFETSLPSDSIVVLSLAMRTVQTMGTVNVTADRAQSYLARTGFVDRRRLGLGSFLSPAEIDSMADLVATPSQFLRGLRGIDLQCGGTACVPVPRNHASCLDLFVDGVPHGPARIIDSLGLNPNAISAIEVYDRPSVVPIEFQGGPPQKQGKGVSLTSGCGAIALWTTTRIPR